MEGSELICTACRKPFGDRVRCESHECYPAMEGSEPQEGDIVDLGNRLEIALGERDALLSQLRQVEGERDDLRIQHQAWTEVFGTTQLTHARARLEATEKERDRYKAALEKIAALHHDCRSTVFAREALRQESKDRKGE